MVINCSANRTIFSDSSRGMRVDSFTKKSKSQNLARPVRYSTGFSSRMESVEVVKTGLGMRLRSRESVFGGDDRFATNFQNNKVFVEGTGGQTFDAEEMIGC